MEREEIAKIINQIKWCPHRGSCNHTYCESKVITLIDPEDERINYVQETVQQHNLSYNDLLRILVTYTKYIKKKEENEKDLYGKISKIYLMFDLKNTELKSIGNDTCPFI